MLPSCASTIPLAILKSSPVPLPISFVVNCYTQEEIDYYWSNLSAVPEAEQCGWIKDKFGLSWQIVPSIMSEMMASGTEEQLKRVTECFLKMKKFDIAKLEEAYGE